MACQCGGSCGPCHARRLSGMVRGDAPFPHNFPSKKQAAKATSQGSAGPAGVPHQAVATKSVQVPNPAMGQGQAVGQISRVWEVGHSNWGTHTKLKWGQFINAPRARFRQPLDLLSERGDLHPFGSTNRVRRQNHAALDEPHYNTGQVTEAQVVALARARAAATAKRHR